MPPGPDFNRPTPPKPATPEKKLLGTLASGEKVFDRFTSHLDTHPEVKEYLLEALKKINPERKSFLEETFDFGSPIGKSICVETNTDDEIIYAQRPKRVGLTRFVKNKEAKETSLLTVILKKIDDGYILITAFVGPKAEPEPWDKFATEQSILFWQNHALVWGSQEIIPGTESTMPQ